MILCCMYKKIRKILTTNNIHEHFERSTNSPNILFLKSFLVCANVNF